MLFSGYVSMFGKRVLRFDIYVKRRVGVSGDRKKAIVWGVQEFHCSLFLKVFSYFPVLGGLLNCQKCSRDFEIRSRWPLRAKGREGSP